MIIDIEGTDGSGKATQTKLLFEYLVSLGYKCLKLSFPNYASPSSNPIKMYLNGELGDNNSLNGYQASSLFAVDRLITVRQTNIKDYDFVLMDRYTPSNMIHQSTRIKDQQQLDNFLDWIQDFEYNKLRLPTPDITILLDVPADISIELTKARGELKNQQSKDILEQDTSHIHLAYARAKYIADKFNWTVINCTENGKLKSIEEIHNLVVKSVKENLKDNNFLV